MHMLNSERFYACSVDHMYTLDAVDARILLARDSAQEASLIELGNRLGLSRNTVHARLKRLRQTSALDSPEAQLGQASQ